MTLITIPSSPAFTKSEWGFRRTVAMSESPFTGSTQVHKYDKAQWYAVLTLPPMKRSQAVEWQSFFMSCEGVANTFLLGDPDGKSVNGTATTCSLGADVALGDTEINLVIGAGNTINKGSYIQINSSSAAKLYMIVDNNTGNGLATIQPKIKAAAISSTGVTITAAKGVFRMESNDLSWSANELSNYGISFSVIEAL